MRIVITGGSGFIGRRLCLELLRRQHLTGIDGVERAIQEIVLFDTAPSAQPVSNPLVRFVTGDITDPIALGSLLAQDTHSIFHLAAVVSAAAEADFDLGMRINLDGTRLLLDTCRNQKAAPKFIFTSSLATYGGALPDIVDDRIIQTPTTSYGAQKAACELLINDYSRKGFIDGRSLRLPTIAIRPGKPNRAASTWVSSIMRDPLQGQDAECPVRPETPMACLSPRRCIAALIDIHELPADRFISSRSVLLPGLSVTAAEMAAAVVRHAGNRRIGQIHWRHDPAIQKIVDGWPKETRSTFADGLGIKGDQTIDEIVRGFIEDELPAAN